MRLQWMCCLLLAGCAARSTPPATVAEPLPSIPCDLSTAASSAWRETVIDPGPAAFRAPPRYDRKSWTPGNVTMAIHGSAPNLLTFQEVSMPITLDSIAGIRWPRAPVRIGCRETVSGRAAIVHTFSEMREIVLGKGPVPEYKVEMVIEIEPGRFLRFAGVSVNPTLQREQLAIARTIRIIVP